MTVTVTVTELECVNTALSFRCFSIYIYNFIVIMAVRHMLDAQKESSVRDDHKFFPVLGIVIDEFICNMNQNIFIRTNDSLR